MKNNEIYITPRGSRYFLIRGDKSIVGSKTGYSSKEKAESHKRWLYNAKTAIIRNYKNRLYREEKHFKSL